MASRKLIIFLVLIISVFAVSTVYAGIEDYPDSSGTGSSVDVVKTYTFSGTETNTETGVSVPIIKNIGNGYSVSNTTQPTVIPTAKPDERREKIRKNYRDYYFVIEESLRVLEYNAEDFNHAVCMGEKENVNRLKQKLNIAIYDADALMDILGLYNDLRLWNIYHNYIANGKCGLDHGLIAETKGAMDRLHRQTEYLGLWVPSTGQSNYMMEHANCQYGWFTAPNGVCLSENGPTSTKYYHSNGYAVECVWPGNCDRIGVKQMNRCDWVDCGSGSY